VDNKINFRKSESRSQTIIQYVLGVLFTAMEWTAVNSSDNCAITTASETSSLLTVFAIIYLACVHDSLESFTELTVNISWS